MKYEDLTENPALVLNKVENFFGLEHSADFVLDTLAQGKLQVHLPAGNRLRMKKHLFIEFDDAWLKQLPNWKKKIIVYLTPHLMSKYGYKII